MGAGGTEDDHAMQQATESIESGQPAEPEAAPASPKKRRGRPPKKPKTATGEQLFQFLLVSVTFEILVSCTPHCSRHTHSAVRV